MFSRQDQNCALETPLWWGGWSSYVGIPQDEGASTTRTKAIEQATHNRDHGETANMLTTHTEILGISENGKRNQV